MINFEIFLIGLLLTSTLTGLVTEAIKRIMDDLKLDYYANILSGGVAAILAMAIGVIYVVLTGVGFTAQNVTCIIALAFLSWLCAMVGYDKVIQVITQFKKSGKD